MDKLYEIISKLNEKNPFYVIIGVVAIVLVLDYFIVLQHQLKALSSVNPEIVSLKEDLEAAKNNARRKDQFVAEWKKLQQKLGEANRKVKTREEVPMILETISKVANKNGVRIEKIIPHPSIGVLLENDQGRYLSVPVFIAAKSGYHNFGRFLSKLEVEEILLTIPAFEIKRTGDEVSLHNIEIKIDAVIFEAKNKE